MAETRTTPTEVKAILEEGDTLSDSIVSTYIKTANLVVSTTITEALSADILKEIEKWYSAHLIAVTRLKMASKEKVGEASVEYIGQYGTGLDSTPYGIMVKQLDPSGAMVAIGTKPASIFAIPSFEE